MKRLTFLALVLLTACAQPWTTTLALHPQERMTVEVPPRVQHIEVKAKMPVTVTTCDETVARVIDYTAHCGPLTITDERTLQSSAALAAIRVLTRSQNATEPAEPNPVTVSAF